MKPQLFKITILLLLSGIFFSCSNPGSRKNAEEASTYLPVDKALFDTIIRQDSLLFAAFNSRDIEGLKSFFSPDIEVFQDNIGVRTYEETVNAFRDLFTKDYVLKRELVKNSLEVYPIKGYGAIETGLHTFCHKENNKVECATFKFVHIWKNDNGNWKITKLITYDHKN